MHKEFALWSEDAFRVEHNVDHVDFGLSQVKAVIAIDLDEIYVDASVAEGGSGGVN